MIEKILAEKIIKREKYLEKIRDFLGTPVIKVLIWAFKRIWESWKNRGFLAKVCN